MEKHFTIMGQPQGKARPRVVRNHGISRTFTPEKTVNYENLVQLEYERQCSGDPLQGAVEARIVAYFKIPKSVSKRRRAVLISGMVRHTNKPDADNLAKIICDALNRFAFADDSAISDLSVQKRYGEIPRVEVTLTEVEEQGETKP